MASYLPYYLPFRKQNTIVQILITRIDNNNNNIYIYRLLTRHYVLLYYRSEEELRTKSAFV